MSDRFSHLWPPQNPEIQQALASTFQDGDWGRYHGKQTAQLEQALTERFQQPFVHLVCSGTIGIELALRGLGVATGDEVILAAYDFPGNFRCIEAVGARPVLADINPHSWSLDVASFENAISSSTKAVIVSSLHGGLAEIQQIVEIARRHDVLVIEDICQTPGAQMLDRSLGTWGDVAVLSFGGSKLLSAGRGGAVLCEQESIWQRINVFKDRGNDTFALSQLQAAVLNPQLNTLDQLNEIRMQAAQQIIAETQGISGLSGLSHAAHSRPVFYKIAWLVNDCQQRASLLAEAYELGLPLFEGFRGFVKRSARRCGKPVALPHSELAAEATILLHHPVLLAEPSEIEMVCEQLVSLFKKWCS